MASEQHQGHGEAHGCWLVLRTLGHLGGGNPALHSHPRGTGSPVQESQDGEHHPVTPFFRAGFIPEESNAAQRDKNSGWEPWEMCVPRCWLLTVCRLCPQGCAGAKEDGEGEKKKG